MEKRPVTDDSAADQAALKGARRPAGVAPRPWLSHLTEPHLLYPAIAVVMLAVIWGTTLATISRERAAAEHAAALSSQELARTYEAQVVRALYEIDHTLKVVKYAYEHRGRQAILQELKARTLLPPDLLFVVYLTDNLGRVVASSRPSPIVDVEDRDYFQSQKQADILAVGLPRQRPGSEDWRLIFSRRLNAADGSFAGIAMVAVDAAYFVSAYEFSKMGRHGVLGLLGTDGLFRARRSGDVVSAGDRVDYAAVVPATEMAKVESRLVTNPWDGVRRHTSAIQLHEVPLAVIAGLSEDEQMATVQRDKRGYLWRALAGSLLVLLLVTVLGRMSWQLKLTRQHAAEELVAHAARVEHLAYHDELTTLPNRGLFSMLLKQNIIRVSRYSKQLAVLFLDLDHFKTVNDTLGHEAGDHLLQEVATRLRGCVRESDIVARLGGDEFVVLLPELAEERYVVTVARKIIAAIALPFDLPGEDFGVTASVGISLYPQDGLDDQELMKNADIAMYQAKSEGRNTFQFYSEALNASARERVSLESNLRHAIERDELQLHYQAKRDIRSGRITGMEALLRWQHPDLGSVSPLQFIPVAEETGLIVPIGKWVLRTACLQNVAWQKQGLPRLSIAINLSARQFSDEHLLPDLQAMLADTGMEAQLLELEFSESLLLRDVAKALAILAGLRAVGIRIAIDDFGTGYSSLTSLRQFPLDSIKIARSFIRDIVGVTEGRNLASAIIAMGRTLSLSLVAQGVETKEQATFLRDNACTECQGFYLGKPIPAEQMAELLRAGAVIAYDDAQAAHQA